MDKDDPTDYMLTLVENWDFQKKDIRAFLELIRQAWHWKECYKLAGERILRLQLHTGGWSGNESIIQAMQKNRIFWSLSWQQSVRGGHYYFNIDLRQFNADPEK